jgi:hypothetical protein
MTVVYLSPNISRALRMNLAWILALISSNWDNLHRSTRFCKWKVKIKLRVLLERWRTKQADLLLLAILWKMEEAILYKASRLRLPRSRSIIPAILTISLRGEGHCEEQQISNSEIIIEKWINNSSREKQEFFFTYWL